MQDTRPLQGIPEVTETMSGRKGHFIQKVLLLRLGGLQMELPGTWADSVDDHL